MHHYWKLLKDGQVVYLTFKEKEMLKEYIEKEMPDEQEYFYKNFTALIDANDTERSTYACECRKSWFEYQNALMKKSPTAVDKRLQMVLDKISIMENMYGVSIVSRGGSYGSSKLVVVDDATGEEITRS